MSLNLSTMADVILNRENRALRLCLIRDQEQSTHSFDPRSAYERLIYQLPLLIPHEAQWWSRARAYTNELISPSMWGLMKVAGKRLYYADSSKLSMLWQACPEQHRIQFELQEIEQLEQNALGQTKSEHKVISQARLPKAFESLEQALNWLKSQMEYIEEQNSKSLEVKVQEKQATRRWYGTQRHVIALVLDSKLRPLTVRMNAPQFGHCAHAEKRAFDDLIQESQLATYKQLILLSSLKPCKMCAGLWSTHRPPKQALEVHYLHDDPGKNGQHTAFDEHSYAWLEAKTWHSKRTQKESAN